MHNDTDHADKPHAPTTTPVAGTRTTSDAAVPACVKPGVFELRVATSTTWTHDGG